MLKSGKLILVVVLLLALCVPASAYLRQETSTLIGTGNVQKITCLATVDKDTTGIFTYTYVLTYDVGPATVHIFDVQNPNVAAFFGAANEPTGTGQFANPADGNNTWVNWFDGVLDVGQTRTFSYKSYYAPQDIDVWAYAVDGGASAKGKTLGMGDKIPEPSSVAAILFGIAGLAPVMIRRRK